MTVTELPVVHQVCAFCTQTTPQGAAHTCTGSRLFREREARRLAEQKVQEKRDAEIELQAIRARRTPPHFVPDHVRRERLELHQRMLEEAEEGKWRRPCERCGKTPRLASEPVTPGTVLATHGMAHVCVKDLDPSLRALAENPVHSEIAALKQRLADLESK